MMGGEEKEESVKEKKPLKKKNKTHVREREKVTWVFSKIQTLVVNHGVGKWVQVRSRRRRGFAGK